MRTLFNLLTTVALRFRWITLILAAIVLVLGVIGAASLNQELLPPIEFPQSFILAQASGMTSEEVRTVLTERVEAEVGEIDAIVNLESTTNGAFGAFITAANDFGLNQTRLRNEIQSAIDSVWLPLRRIEPADGQNPQAFAETLLNDLNAEIILFLAERDSNLLFQFSEETWLALSDETVMTIVDYLANQVGDSSGTKTALERLVEQEFVPQLQELESIASIQISGGQALPGEEAKFEAVEVAADDADTRRQILQLSPEVWESIAGKIGVADVLTPELAAELAQGSYTIPETAPPLPESWQVDQFIDATDLLEMVGGSRSLAGVFNDFAETGKIIGALGKTNDLTPEIVAQMLEIEPTLVQYFEAEHLSAMSPDVFDILPDEFIEDLDGFTRDELAAAALAQSITGEQATPEPVTLPSAWRIQPPQIITFSFADLPLATFSVSTVGDADELVIGDNTETANEETISDDREDEDDTEQATDTPPDLSDVPKGPALPQLFSIMGEFFGAQLDTADDLLLITLPDEFAELFGNDQLQAADFFNSLLFIGDAVGQTGGDDPGTIPGGFDPASFDIAEFLPALVECGVGLLDVTSGTFDFAGAIIGCVDADSVTFLVENDPEFLPNLQPEIYEAFSDEVLALPEISPILSDTWSTLANQPEFSNQSLRTADDLIAIGGGSPATILNTINETIPAQFDGYEVRLLDSLTPTVVRYFASQEEDFYANLDTAVLLKLSPEVLAELPEDALSNLNEETTSQLGAIVAGEAPSAAQELADLYVTDVPPADPSAPVLNPEWDFIAGFIPGVELKNAYDLFRFPDSIDTPGMFINNLFNSPGGANFAPDLLGGMSQEAFDYIAENDPNFVSELSPEALLLLPEEIFNGLPASVQEFAQAGEVFVPSNNVTRTNGSASLFVTVFKPVESNTVEAFYDALEVIDRIDEENDRIEVNIAFEQSSFVEESISGVVREGSMGAIFATINILIFLSGGFWNRSSRRIVGLIVIALFVALLIVLTLIGLDAAGGDFMEAFNQSDPVLRVLLIVGVLAGVLILFYPGRLPYPSWRPTLVIGLSIPLSILGAMAIMYWLPPLVHQILGPAEEATGLIAFILRLFPDNLTLNIMTLSGLTVAIGRLVDDSIVVLENVFRQMQSGMDKREAILSGARDVSVAIFWATVIAVVVFLPLGLTGGIIGEFFLPFGLAVTYTLAASFLVAVTVVPVLVWLIIGVDDVPEESELWIERGYVPVLRWALSSRWTQGLVILIAILSLGFGGFLLSNRPAAFLPDFGEPQLVVSAELPQGTKIVETNDLVNEMEAYLEQRIPEDEFVTLQTQIGGTTGLESLIGGNTAVAENVAEMTLTVNTPDLLDDALADEILAEAETIFGDGNVDVSVVTFSSQGGFGGFELVVSAADQAELEAIDADIIEQLNSIDGITNVTSNLSQAGGVSGDGPTTFIRINQEPALSYTGELETQDTINIVQQAIEKIQALPNLPGNVTVSQGFDSELQTQGFLDLIQAMIIAISIVVIILIIVFRSAVYWLSLILSIVVAPVGAAIALTVTDRVLGISAMIGLLMVFGLVVTNAVVLIDRVITNRTERGMNLYDALIEAGARRLRPILMTSLATIIALIPLAIGLSSGAIIAEELGTVVIGGVMSSTILTLIVVPVAYSLLNPIHERLVRLVGLGGRSSK